MGFCRYSARIHKPVTVKKIEGCQKIEKMIHQRMMNLLLPCRCQTSMSSSLDTLLLDPKESGYGEQQLVIEAIEQRGLM